MEKGAFYMHKARIVLSVISLFAILAGAVAFKAIRFNGLPVWHSTTYITTLANGRVYATYAPNLYTQTGATLFSTQNPSMPLSTVYDTTPTLPPTKVVGTATDGSGFTHTIGTFPVTTTVTRVTTLN